MEQCNCSALANEWQWKQSIADAIFVEAVSAAMATGSSLDPAHAADEAWRAAEALNKHHEGSWAAVKKQLDANHPEDRCNSKTPPIGGFPEDRN